MRNYVSTNSNESQSSYVGSPGEITVDPSTREARIHDGVTPGGAVFGGGGSSTALPYLELTNVPFIIQPAELGDPVSFVRTPSGSETDPIDTGLTIARGAVGGLYNIESEPGYDNITHNSPAGTEWNSDGWGDLVGLHARTYGNLRSVLDNNIGNNIIGAELIMHDTINDKYYKFSFSDWGQNNGGSFAYTRTQIVDPNYFKKVDYGNQVDDIAEGIGITRGNNKGIYNPYRESGWNQDVSPAGTLWNSAGWNDLTDTTSRTYTNFYAAAGGNLGNNVPGTEFVMYVPDTEKYYAIKFLSWTQGNNGGGFSYTRNEIDLTALGEGLKFADGTVLKSAAGLSRVKSTASGGRRIEEAVGSKTVSTTARTTVNLTGTASRTQENISIIWIDSTTTTIDEVFENPTQYDVNDAPKEFSVDNINWYTFDGGINYDGTERGYNITGTVTYTQGDTIYFRYGAGGNPVVWWDKADLPGGSANFRGAIIDYHAYTGDATWIGTIHVVDDNGDDHITHTEVMSGSSDGENDDLWVVTDEGTIKYRRIDGDTNTLKVHWTAKVFYGEEFYD